MVTWKMGFQGFLDRPLLGYGQENFYQVFDKNYTTKNTEQWFDRCHNMICDRSITSGILGLLAYLALLLLPFYALWAYYTKEYGKKQEGQENVSRKYLTPIVFSILIIAYILQNMFIFEALVTYVPLIIVLSFVGLYSTKFDSEYLGSDNFKRISTIVVLILVGPALWIFNLGPYSANRDFIKVLASGSNVSLNNRIDAFEEVIARGTYGNQEYRRHYFSVFENVVSEYLSNPQNRTEANDKLVADFSHKMEAQFVNQIAENPRSISNYLLVLRFYNLSYFFDINRLNRSIALTDTVIALSPGRPQAYYELGTSHYYLGNYYVSTGKLTEAQDQYRAALDVFYDGASQNVDSAQALSQLSSFLSAVSTNTNNEILAQALLAGGNKHLITDVTKQMIAWLTTAEATQTPDEHANSKAQIKTILEWLQKADPKNDSLQAQLNLLQ